MQARLLGQLGLPLVAAARQDMNPMFTDIAALATAVGVLTAVYQLFLSRRQARATFEQQFVQRYWQLDDSRLVTSKNSFFERRYLRLCEDEFESMRLGQVSWRTWMVWHDSIRDMAGPMRERISDGHLWLKTCLDSGDHPGTHCDGIFRQTTLDGYEHSKHLSTRWWSSLDRRWFLLLSDVQRRLAARNRQFRSRRR